ncbi:MAG: hypothetical protein AAGD11_09610 [Planctomycetota bacterium]
MAHLRIRSHRYRRAGYTLLELAVASASSVVLVGGLASSIFIAAQSLDVTDGTLADARRANQILDQINHDLQSAVMLSELSSTAVTMSVPDRDGDNVPETIRYAWSGVAGDPLTKVYNGGTAVTVAGNVQGFSMEWISRFIEGVTSLPIILFVSSEASSGDDGLATPSAAEQDRIDVMEGWGYDVTVISQQATQVEFDSQLATANVVYVAGSVSSATLSTKLNAATIGVVTESFAHAETLGFYDSLVGYTDDRQTIHLTDTTHYITEGYSLGDLTIADADQSFKLTFATLAPEASILAVYHNALPLPNFAILDEGDELADASLAAGRRCQLPWGEDTFDVGQLNADGLIIMQRAVEWAAGAGDDTETTPSGVVFEEYTETQASSNTRDLTINVPSGYAADDLLIATVVTDGNEASSMTPPSGWTEIYLGENNNGRVTLGIWWKLASSSEPSDYTFDWSGNEEAYGWMMRFTGHNAASPIHDTGTTQGSSNTPSTVAVTTTEDNCMILRIGGFDDDDVSTGDAGMSGHTTITAEQSGSGSGTCSGAAAYAMLDAAGDSGTANFDLSGSGSEEFRTVTIAIEPSP